MVKKYSVKSESRRWPLQVFYNILDLAGINAWILYKETTGGKISRHDFMFQLDHELIIENIKSEMKSQEANVQSTSKISPFSRK